MCIRDSRRVVLYSPHPSGNFTHFNGNIWHYLLRGCGSVEPVFRSAQLEIFTGNDIGISPPLVLLFAPLPALTAGVDGLGSSCLEIISNGNHYKTGCCARGSS